MPVPMANHPPFATLNHFAADLGIPSESKSSRVGINTQQFMGVVKGSARVGAGNLDKLEIVVCGALGNSRIGIFEQVGCLLAGHLRLRVGVLGMCDALLGHLT